ncbi:hypothetical protein HPO96_29335 [Kribbella sandramycini]|uniref:Uncharacterized protein n=1 Tax=Kribbella sandramycini TaxID=60450 RepID=A0A7Y4P3P0_9ACTN|nr:hypothetical protein [Kribbella sandramycini]MBB6571715.1 hypothetical protein [Kribbella sandramycini]NOL44359.1 hypothetical protein [Kribbella sandramycini]
MITATCQCRCHVLTHTGDERPARLNPADAANEVRARWSCDELSEFLGVDAVPAHDAMGAITGWVAVDPEALRQAVYAFADRPREEGF